ncbi:hypothetical protein DAEQUDRAFT_673722 [Daedalea quercina L-15889]|uniref:Mediator of RNA polymerase II transcription subunit 12 n=1 Tax=Daedalea quercina L-15889 TaxID=1314783 RepID=A0A165NND0_9APHY|nr:hypothetical protein DAEQUDRAFT_673722 [Daedalea quercina L-15889]
MAKGEKETLPIYELHPPPWLPKTHTSADIGYTGFHPPRPGDVEEVLTDVTVQNGLILPPLVSAEGWTAINQMQDPQRLQHLEDLMNKIFLRRAENIPPVPASTFRMPSRVTLNDTKRQQWFADLANPDVPLYKLGKNVPHGAKGHDLLDLLHSNNVAIERAVWFLRVFGGNESAGLRNKPGYNPTQYSIEWANVVTSYMKKQLADIALPTAPRPGLNIKMTFKNMLADPQSRERWMSRFSYCLELLRTFYAEGLVDSRTFLTWLVQQTWTCNLAQLGFVARLADEYLDGVLINRALTHHFVDACLNRLDEARHIRSTAAKEFLSSLESTLRNLVARSFLALPDAFISPRVWQLHSELLGDILSTAAALAEGTLAPSAQVLQQTFQELFADVRRRNEAMLFRHLPPRVVGSLTSALSDIKLLNSLSGDTDISSVVFFEDALALVPHPSFARKLDILLTWSVTSLQYGDHRPYAAACILQEWRRKAGERAIRHEAEAPDQFIQDQVFDWLDGSSDAADPVNLPAVSLLFGQLVKQGLFCYQQYVQRLIARGEAGLSFSQEGYSRHRDFLRWTCLHTADASVIRQRKVTLYGVRVRQTPEDEHEHEMRSELRALLPEVFNGQARCAQSLATKFWERCPTLLTSPRYEQVRTVREWLLPILRKHIARYQALANGSSDVLKTFTLSVILMAHTKCYGSLLELTLFTLERATTHQLLVVVIETLCQHMEVWACMNVMRNVAAGLYAAHQYWRGRGIHSRQLLSLLMQVDKGRYLEQAQRDQVTNDVSAFSHALHPMSQSSNTVPVHLPEVLLLATDPNPEAPSNLAKSLWYKYMTTANWAWTVWDNTIASLRQIPVMIADSQGRRACALKYAHFLWQVDQHLPQGFDSHVLEWFLGSGKNEAAALTVEVWDVVRVVLLQLCIYGALTTTTILQGLIYSVWQSAATASTPEQGQSLEVLLSAVNALFEHLLLKDECGTGLPPADIFEAQGLQTRRRDVFREPHFSKLVDNLPALVLVEHNSFLSDALRQGSCALRESICRFSVFRLGVYRDLDAVRYAFEKLLECRTVSEELHAHLVAALRLMLRDPSQEDSDGFATMSSLLTPWKLAATAIEMRLTLKQLAEGLTRESMQKAANVSLDRLGHFVFHQCKSAEEVDFVAEMMTEVSIDVAGKFVNAGLQRIVELFQEPFEPTKADDVHAFVANTGEVLRLLSKIVERFRQNATLPTLDPAAQDKFFSGLVGRFAQMEEAWATGRSDGAEDSLNQASHCIIFLARLLQFDLGFPGAWTPQATELSSTLCGTLFDLVLLHADGSGLDIVAFPLLFDTLLYLLDETSVDPKSATLDPFRNYPEIELSQLPAGTPPEYRARIRTLLPYVALNPVVADLAYATRDASGALTLTQPVQHRPWEWTEYLGDVSPGEVNPRTDERAGTRIEEHGSVRNSASVALELFGARLTGDILVAAHTGGDQRVEAALRTFQDDLSSESVFARDWREARVALNDEGSRSRSVTDHEDGVAPTGQYQGASRRGSPALSTRSGVARVSGSSSAGSRRQSPATSTTVGHPLSRLSVSTASEPIDVDAFDFANVATTSTAKRRLDDDEVQIVEGPARTSKKPRGKVGSRTKGKKR